MLIKFHKNQYKNYLQQIYELGYYILKSVIDTVKHNGIFNLMFETTLWNYGSHVGGHSKVHHHGATYIYTKYAEILFASN